MEHRGADAAWPVAQHSRFDLAPPRHFLLPAVLLLLAEEPSYGYHLVKELEDLRFGRVDRPSVYRALAQLERDGLVESWSGRAEGRPGPAGVRPHRRGRAGPAGVDGRDQGGARRPRPRAAPLRRDRHGRRRAGRGRGRVGRGDGPSVVAGVGHVAHRRHRHGIQPAVPVRRRREVVSNGRDEPAAPGRPERVDRARFAVVPDRSVVLDRGALDGRPITFGVIGVTGVIEAEVARRRGAAGTSADGAPGDRGRPRLRSGNGLYDAELLRRIDARRFPVVALDLRRLRARSARPTATTSTARSPSTVSPARSRERSSCRLPQPGQLVVERRAGRRHPRLRHRVADGADAADLPGRRGEAAGRGGADGSEPVRSDGDAHRASPRATCSAPAPAARTSTTSCRRSGRSATPRSSTTSSAACARTPATRCASSPTWSSRPDADGSTPMSGVERAGPRRARSSRWSVASDRGRRSGPGRCPRSPTTSPGRADRRLGARVEPPLGAVGPHDPVLDARTVGRIATASLERLPHARRGRRGATQARWASSVPSKSSGSTPWMRWSSSLHCTAPVATSHSHRPTWASASPLAQPGLGLGQRRLRQALLGQVLRDRRPHPTTLPRRRAADGATARPGRGMPSCAATSVSTWSTRVAAERPSSSSLGDLGRGGGRGTATSIGWPTISASSVAEDALGAAVPRGDAALPVVG